MHTTRNGHYCSQSRLPRPRPPKPEQELWTLIVMLCSHPAIQPSAAGGTGSQPVSQPASAPHEPERPGRPVGGARVRDPCMEPRATRHQRGSNESAFRMTNPCRNAASVRLPDLSFVRLPACATHVYAPVALRTERPRHVACRTPQPSPRPQTASAFGRGPSQHPPLAEAPVSIRLWPRPQSASAFGRGLSQHPPLAEASDSIRLWLGLRRLRPLLARAGAARRHHGGDDARDGQPRVLGLGAVVTEEGGAEADERRAQHSRRH